jgi:hypothetical protein
MADRGFEKAHKVERESRVGWQSLRYSANQIGGSIIYASDSWSTYIYVCLGLRVNKGLLKKVKQYPNMSGVCTVDRQDAASSGGFSPLSFLKGPHNNCYAMKLSVFFRERNRNSPIL